MKTLAKRNRGQSVVEFALVIPILMMAFVGIFEFSRVMMTLNTLTSASREGARAAAVGEDPYQAIDRVLSAAVISATPNVVYDSNPHGPVKVDVSISNYQFSIPFLGPFIFPLTGSTTMRQE
jgi:Flp pilus assembly protein TadG